MAISVNRNFVMLGVLLATAAAQAEPPDAPRGAALLAPFKQDLQAALRLGLAEGSVEAIAACRLSAPKIAMASSRDGVRVGRASHRLRNPANMTPDWVRPILDEYVTSPAGRAPRSVPLENRREGYVEPVLLQPLCLTCHGSRLAPDVASRIRELYPDDRAVGFEVGDLRGVFWVEYPVAE